MTITACLVIALIHGVNGMCPPLCVCKNNILHCDSKVPEVLPQGTQEVYINRLTFNKNFGEDRPFASPSWRNISNLDITLQMSTEIGYVAAKTFTGLQNLETLGVHGIKHNLTSETPLTIYAAFSKHAFDGLDNLKHLNISGNPSLHIMALVPMLCDKDIMPVLEILDISQMQKPQKGPIEFAYDINPFLRDCISVRPIKALFMNGMVFDLYLSSFEQLCTTMEKLSMRNAYLVYVYFPFDFVCESLKQFDLSNSKLPTVQANLNHRLNPDLDFAEYFNRHFFSVMFSAQTLLFDNIIPSLSTPISFEEGYTYDCTNINFRIQYLSFRQNNLLKLNVSFRNMPFRQGSQIDLSFNRIEFIHPKCIDPGKNIININLSNNDLYKMETNHFDEFRTFLYSYCDLEEFNLSFNKIKRIHSDMFSKNKNLHKINLANNLLIEIDMNQLGLVSLNYLNIWNNHLRNLDRITRQNMQLLSNNNSEFTLILGKNDFECTCDEFSFETWVKASTFLKGEDYICSFNDAYFDMKATAIEEIQHICKQQLVERICIIFFSTLVSVLIVSIMVIVLVRRHRLKRDRVKQILKQLKQAEVNECFLVYLAYCSEDAALVNRNIFKQLNDEISKTVGKKGSYVCMDEKHFRPGFPIMTEIMSNVEKSYVMICVVSQAFCSKTWCQMEVEEAYNLRKPIILLINGHIEKANLSKIMSRLFQRNTIAKIITGRDGTCQINPTLDVLCSSVFDLAANSAIE